MSPTTLLNRYADVITRPQAHSATERARAAELLRLAAERPFTAAQAAEFLHLSKPTVLKLVRAGLLLEVPDSSEEARKLDPGLVLEARRILEQAVAGGTVEDRLAPLRDVIDALEANAIEAAAASGAGSVPDEVMVRARERRERRLRQRGEGSR